jgi:hypothetical protein
MRRIALLLLPLLLLVKSATDRCCISASMCRIGFEILFFRVFFLHLARLRARACCLPVLPCVLRPSRTSRNCS